MGERNKIYISYVGGLGYGLQEDVYLVEGEADYVQACHKLLQHRETGAGLRIWVRAKAHYTWLKEFVDQIACRVLFEEKTPRLVLAEQWNVEIPDWLSDSDVLGLNLLEINVDTLTPASFGTRYLSHYLGSVFNADRLDTDNLVAVIKALVSSGAEAAFLEQPLLNRCLVEKCAQWSQKTNEQWVKELCKRLADDYNPIWHYLSAWSILHSYPDKLLEFVLTPDQAHFVRKIPSGALSNLPLEPMGREQALTQIEQFFLEIKAQVGTSKEFIEIVSLMSGRFSQEYSFALKVLKSNLFEPTRTDIETLREKFEACPGVTQTQLDSLKYIVKPVRPVLAAAEDKWGFSEWIEWAVDQYIPYRAWQVHNKYYDADLEDTVEKFTNWYVLEYGSIHGDIDFSLAYSLNDLNEGLGSGLTFVLLVDCLPLQYVEILNEALRNAGFYRHSVAYRFSGLPTVTAGNKAALLAGNWLVDAGDYEAILKKRSVSEWGGKKLIYLRDLRSMAEMEVPGDAAVVVFNLLDADEILHSDVESKNITYDDELHRIFNRVADGLRRISEEWCGSRDSFDLRVVTDHGACRILEEEKKTFESGIVKKLFSDEKYRFSAVSEEQSGDISPNLWDMGYRFKRPFAPAGTVYFIPRGHNTVRHAGLVKGHLHGGATPEEVIVPIMHYKLVEVARGKPLTRFLNLDLNKDTTRARFYIQRVVMIEIEIQNPNKSEVKVFRASIISPEADLKSFETTIVPVEETGHIKISCYFKRSALGEKDLELELAYEIEGEKHVLPLSLKSEFVSAQKGGFSLKDL